MTSTLYLALTGAPLTRRIADAVPLARERGWASAAVPTDAAWHWLDTGRLDALGVPVVSAQRMPSEPKRLPRPDAVAVAPATFNTVNKLANGIADTYVMSTLCEALGARVPMVLVPFVNRSLAGHPSWASSLAILRDTGVTVVDPRDGSVTTYEPLDSGTGEAVTDAFRWSWVLDRLPPAPQRSERDG